MRRLSLSVLVLAAVHLLGTLLSATPAYAEQKRIALILANEDYPASIGKLSNTHNDAHMVGNALSAIGFSVTKILDGNSEQMETALTEFELAIDAEASDGDDVVAFVYASMHGASTNVEGRSRNFLLPAREEIVTTGQLIRKGIRMDHLIQGLSATDASAVFVISDACRNELRQSYSKSAMKGWVPERASTGVLVAFATPAGSTTPDDGLFARVLARELRETGRKASFAMLEVVEEVAKRRNFDGQPVLTSGGLPEWLCFAGCSDESQSIDADLNDWTRLSDLNTLSAYEAYLSLHPEGRFRELADEAIKALTTVGSKPKSEGADNVNIASDVVPQRRVQAAGTFLDCSACPEMIVIPAGSFRMGVPSSWSDSWKDAKPNRTVHIKSFAAGAFEVTWGEWRACQSEGICPPLPGNRAFGMEDQHPVNEVTWHQTAHFIDWLNSQVAGAPYRLLTESEWEYAAKAGGFGWYSWGNETPVCTDAASNGAHYDGCGEFSSRHVGSFRPNAFGLYDMHGNVSEWVHDCYKEGYVDAPIDGSAVSKSPCDSRVRRGGGFLNLSNTLLSAARNWLAPGNRAVHTGFRVARDLD